MNFLESVLVLMVLMALSAVISAAEIALAGSRKIKLQRLADEGDNRAFQVLRLQEQPGRFIAVVQIGLNMIAIGGGVVGESALRPFLYRVSEPYIPVQWLDGTSSWLAFFCVTFVFVLLADLIPKRLAMIRPEPIALYTAPIMTFLIVVLKPVVWLFDFLANLMFALFHLPTVRQENLTSADIVAFVDAGAQAGVVKAQEQHLIENIFDMQTRRVTSTMTTREYIVFFDRHDNREVVLEAVARYPHSKLLICDNGLDKIIGYVESHALLTRYLQENEEVTLTDSRLLRKPLFIPDTLSVYEVLELFKSAGEDFAVIVNEYALVVGVVTLNDVMSIVMGELISGEEEPMIVRRDEDSWLIDGATPWGDVLRALDLDEFPETENYETIGGFMMYMLRKIPKKTDFVLYQQYKFEIIDTENFKIDQLMVSRHKDQKTE